MRFREVYIEDRKSIADSGTETIDIDLVDPVTQFGLWFWVKNGSAKAPNVPAASCVSKVELVDGSDVLVSMNAQELIALHAYDTGKLPFRWLQEHEGMSQYDLIPINFGRFLGDEEYAFDPTRFTNPQLKITWAKNTLHATGSVKYSLFARVMEGAAKPSGFFMSKVIDSFASAASGDKRVDLPTDYPYRKLMVRAYKAGTDMNDIITNLKLSLDMDKIIPFDLDSHDFVFLMHQWFPEFELWKRDRVVDGATREAWFGAYNWATAVADEGAITVRLTGTHGSSYTVNSLKADGTANTSDVSILVTVRGIAPESTFCYPFGKPNLPETWLPASEFSSIRLILTQGTATADVDVILQQERKY